MERIKKYLEKFKDKKVAVAYSGGVDSSLVALAAKGIGDSITIRSEFTPSYIVDEAKDFAKRFGIRHRIEDMSVLNDEIKKNPTNRCYLCKLKIIKKIKDLGYSVILDGTNKDDLREERPGLKAKEKEGIISPLADLGLGKEEIREIMAEIDGNTAKRPSESCLATRIPFNSEITIERLRRIEKAEEFIRSRGLSHVRVRDHFPLARIEVLSDEFDIVVREKNLAPMLKNLGYEFVTLDLEPYKELN